MQHNVGPSYPTSSYPIPSYLNPRENIFHHLNMLLKLVKCVCLIQHSLRVSSRWLKCNVARVDSHCLAVNYGGTGLGGCPPYQRQASVFNDGNKRHQIASVGVNEVNKLDFSQRKEREHLRSRDFFVLLSPNENTIVLRYLRRVVLCVVTENKAMTQSTSEALRERRDDSCVPNPVLPSAHFNAVHFLCDALRSKHQ